MWEWLGYNAGQIQIVIAVIALVLAYVVYKKVLKQIEISQHQGQVANDQRGLDLKIQSLSLSLMALDRNNAKIKNLQEVLKLCKEALNSLSTSSELNYKEIQDLAETISSHIEGAEEVQYELLHLCNTINEQETLHNFDILKSIYELLISITNDHNLSDSMKHHFVKNEVVNKD